MLTDRLVAIARRRPIVAYVTLAYALSWTVWILGFVALPPDVPFVPVVVLGVFGPAVAAALVKRASGERVRAWLAGILDWRVAPRWYAAALSVPIAWYGVATVFLIGSGASVRPERAGRGVLLFVGALPAATVLTGGNEELGWRGFLLPRLQRRHSALVASLLVGVVWAGWHLPVYLLPLGLTEGPFHLFLPFVAFASVAFTWVYNGTGGCVVVAMLLHGSTNSAIALFSGVLVLDSAADAAPWRVRIVGALVVAAILLVRYGPATLAAGSEPAVTREPGTTPGEPSVRDRSDGPR